MSPKEVQEWLTLSGYALVIDNDWGPASTAAMRRFQADHGLPVTGQIDQVTESILTTPLRVCTEPIVPGGSQIGPLVVAYSRRYLSQKAREAGADNCGPWVRLFMHGKEGNLWPWCAGYATSIVVQAATTLHIPSPITYAVGCDAIAKEAQERGRLSLDISRVLPGDLFLVPQPVPKFGFQHIGIVMEVYRDHFVSNEGNSNTNGSRNGYEVTSISRSWAGKTFVLVNGEGGTT